MSSTNDPIWYSELPARLVAAARHFAADDAGATAIEYAILTLIGVGIIVIMAQISGGLNDVFGRLQTFVDGG